MKSKWIFLLFILSGLNAIGQEYELTTNSSTFPINYWKDRVPTKKLENYLNHYNHNYREAEYRADYFMTIPFLSSAIAATKSKEEYILNQWKKWESDEGIPSDIVESEIRTIIPKVNIFFGRYANQITNLSDSKLREFLFNYYDIIEFLDKKIEEAEVPSNKVALKELRSSIRSVFFGITAEQTTIQNKRILKLEDDINRIVKKDENLSTKLKDLIDSKFSELSKEMDSQLKKKFILSELKNRESNFKEYKNFAAGLSSVVGLIDKELGNDFNVLSLNALTIASSLDIINTYSETTGIISSAKLFGAYGNLLFASSAIISHFATKDNNNNKAFSQIIKMLVSISNQINSFQIESRERFDNIDQQLYYLQESIISGFNSVFQGINSISELIQISRKELNELKNNLEIIRKQELINQRNLIWSEKFSSINNQCFSIEYLKRNIEEFDEPKCLNQYYDWLTLYSKLPVMSGFPISYKELSNIALLNLNLKGDFEYEINIYNKFLQSRGDKKNYILPNPRSWDLGLRAYRLFVIQHNRIDKAFEKKLHEENTKLEEFKEKIRNDSTLLKDLVNEYKSTLDSLSSYLFKNYSKWTIKNNFDNYLQELEYVSNELNRELNLTNDSSMIEKANKIVRETAKNQLGKLQNEIKRINEIQTNSVDLKDQSRMFYVIKPKPNSVFRQHLLIEEKELADIINDKEVFSFIKGFQEINLNYDIKSDVINELWNEFGNYQANSENQSFKHFEMLKSAGFSCYYTKSQWGRCYWKKPHNKLKSIEFSITISGIPVVKKHIIFNSNDEYVIPVANSGELNQNTFLRSQFSGKYFNLKNYNPNSRPFKDKYVDRTNFKSLNYTSNIRKVFIDEPNRIDFEFNEFKKELATITRSKKMINNNEKSMLLFKLIDSNEDIEFLKLKLNVISKLISGFIYHGYYDIYSREKTVKTVLDPSLGIKSGETIIFDLSNLLNFSEGYLMFESYFERVMLDYKENLNYLKNILDLNNLSIKESIQK